MFNLQYFPKRPDCTVFYCLSLALWVKVLIGIGSALFIIFVVAFGICRFFPERTKCKEKKQVETELSEKDKEGSSDYRGYCDNTRPLKPKVTYDDGVWA